MVSVLFSGAFATASDYPAAGVFEIIKDESELRVLIYPAGLLANFGHSHVISTNEIDGRIVIAEESAASSVELTIPVESFEIDIEALRREEGQAFEKPVPDKAKRGTRKNMLGPRVLDSARFSTITVRSREWSGDLPDIVVNAEFTIRDQINVLEFPASVATGDHQIVISGSFAVLHGQLGLKPFKAAFGSLRVRDEIDIKFRITARLKTD